MMFAAQLSLGDIAILEEAIDQALALAAERNIEVAPGELAAQLCEASERRAQSDAYRRGSGRTPSVLH